MRRSDGPSQCKAGERSEPGPKGALNFDQGKTTRLRTLTKEHGIAHLEEEQAQLE